MKKLIFLLFLIIITGCDAKHSPGSDTAPGGGQTPTDSGKPGDGTDSNNGGVENQIKFGQVMNEVIIAGHCLNCHSANTQKGGVDLSTREKILANPGLVNVGKPELSELYLVVAEGSMPPPKKFAALSDDQTKLLFDWIASGAN